MCLLLPGPRLISSRSEILSAAGKPLESIDCSLAAMMNISNAAPKNINMPSARTVLFFFGCIKERQFYHRGLVSLQISFSFSDPCVYTREASAAERLRSDELTGNWLLAWSDCVTGSRCRKESSLLFAHAGGSFPRVLLAQNRVPVTHEKPLPWI